MDAQLKKKVVFQCFFLSKSLLKIAGSKCKNSICHVCIVLEDESVAFPCSVVGFACEH